MCLLNVLILVLNFSLEFIKSTRVALIILAILGFEDNVASLLTNLRAGLPWAIATTRAWRATTDETSKHLIGLSSATATATMRAVDLSVSIKFSEVVIVIAAVILEGDLCEVIIVIGLRLA